MNDGSLYSTKLPWNFRPTPSHLGHRLDYDIEEILLHFTIAYELRTYDFPVYVGPGTDPDTEELRAVLRMLNHQSPAVPEDPKEGGELLTLSLAFARHLQVLSLVAKGMTIPYDDELLNEVRHKNAQFRLVFRLPHQMHFSDEDRRIVIDHMKMNIETIRRGVEEGTHPSSWVESIQEATRRILERQKTHEDHVEL
ncbi:hypothetical protein AAVH_26465 [Aphelenchoides avenae]|nr:hypothetical protein AAVH_26465 [Aphelenchus avenae]